MQLFSQIQSACQNSKKPGRTESPDWPAPMLNIRLQKLLWIYYYGHAEVKVTKQTDCWAKEPSHVACLLRSMYWRVWQTTYEHKAKAHQTVDCVEERGLQKVVTDDWTWKDQIQPLSIKHLKLFQYETQRQHWDKSWDGRTHMGFLAHTYIPAWSDLSRKTRKNNEQQTKIQVLVIFWPLKSGEQI